MKRIKQKRIWFLSYILTVLVCILIGYIVTGFSERVLKEQINETMFNAFSNTITTISHRIDSQQTNMYAVLENQNVVSLSNKYSNFSRIDESELIGHIMDEMSVQFAMADIANEHYICFDNKDIVLGINEVLDKDSAYKYWFSNVYPSRQEWLDSIFSTRRLIEFRVFNDKNGNRKAALIQKRIRNIGARPSSVAISIIDERLLFDSLYEDDTTKTVLLYDGEVIFSSHSGLNYSSIEKNGTRVTVDGKSYVQFGAEKNGIYFIQLFNNENYTRQLKGIKLLGLAINVVIFLFGILMAAYFTRINYKPLRRVMSRLRVDMSDENEYIAIEKSIENVLNDRTDMTKRLRETDKRISETYNKMLLSAGSRKEIKSIAEGLQIKFAHRYFALVAFRLTNLGIVAGENETNSEDIEIAAFSIANVFGELLPEEITCDWCLLDDTCVCILNFTRQDKLDDVFDTARSVCEFMKENFRMRLSVFISSGGSLGDLPQMKKELEALGIPAKFLPERDSFIYGDYAEYALKIWNANYKNLLLESIASGNAPVAENVVNEFFACGLLENVEPQLGKKIFFETLFSVYAEQRGGCDDGSAIALLLNEGKFAEARKEFIAAFRRFAANDTAEGSDERILQIIAFIEENYANVDLNVSYISNHFNISISRLSRYFKNNTNEGLADYILKYRCNKAVEYINENPGMPVNEIGEACGFYSTGSFIRAFKRIYGVTPGKYNKAQ